MRFLVVWSLFGTLALVMGSGCSSPESFNYAAFLSFPTVEDDTVGKTNVCELHGTLMEETNVPIVYGLLLESEYGKALDAASTNQFPNAKDRVPGGCVVMDISAKNATIYACATCLKNRQTWEAAHTELLNESQIFVLPEVTGSPHWRN